MAWRKIRNIFRLQVLNNNIVGNSAKLPFPCHTILRIGLSASIFFRKSPPYPAADFSEKGFPLLSLLRDSTYRQHRQTKWGIPFLKLMSLKTSQVLKCLFKKCEYICGFGKSSYFCNRFKRAAQKPWKMYTRRICYQRRFRIFQKKSCRLEKENLSLQTQIERLGSAGGDRNNGRN